MKFPNIVSGGQTGADRGSLDWAIQNGIPHEGWCPKGRRAEDGRIPIRYQLREAGRLDYPDRTERNIRFADATVIFSVSAEMGRGSKLTAWLAQSLEKPWLHIHRNTQKPGNLLADFIASKRIVRLNVAGSRASAEPSVEDLVRQVLDQALAILSSRAQ